MGEGRGREGAKDNNITIVVHDVDGFKNQGKAPVLPSYIIKTKRWLPSLENLEGFYKPCLEHHSEPEYLMNFPHFFVLNWKYSH